MAKKSLTRWNDIVKESEQSVAIWVGVDVHKESYAVAVLSDRGVLHCFSTTSDDAGLIEQFQSRGIHINQLAYEAGPTGFGLYRACQAAGIPAMVVAASRVPKMPCKTAKTDRIDCIKLAEYLSRGLLSPITVPSEDQEAVRSKARRRSLISKEIGQTKVRIKSFLLANGLHEPIGIKSWSKEAVSILETMPMHPDLRFTLDSYLRQMVFLMGELALFEKDLRESVLPANDVLQSIPGVGPIVAGIFRTEIFDPQRFETGEQIANYLGLAPVVRQSGDRSGTTRLVPCGQGKLRGVLVEAAWSLRRQEQWASDFYGRILSRTGRAQKAIVALARKLAIIMWRLWLEERPYQSVHVPAKPQSA